MIRDATLFITQEQMFLEKCSGEGSELTLKKAINFVKRERTREISK